MRKPICDFSIAAISVLAFNTLLAAQENVATTQLSQVPVLFEEVAMSDESAIPFEPGESTLLAEHVGRRTTLFGRLTDTSAINMFYASWHDGREIVDRRYYVEDRVFEQPHTSIWATVEATITKADTRFDDKHEIRIHSYRGLTTADVQALARASVTSQQWITDNRMLIDLNKFKDGHPKPPLVDMAKWKSDFNKLSHRDDVEIRSLDMKRSIVELCCSRYIVDEVRNHHASFIDLIMVYDLKADAPIRLLVRGGGYFLE